MTARASFLRLIVFDLDGTLIDSIGDIASAANQSLVETFGENARLPQDVVRGFVGSGARQLIERCVAESGGRPEDVAFIFDRFLSIYGSRLTATTRLYPGLDSCLVELGRIARLAVLTNKPGLMSRTIIQDLGLADSFISVIGGDDLKTKKPDPEGLLDIVARAKVRPDEVAMVGDSAVDIRTARNAGVTSVGVLWGYDRDGVLHEGPDIAVERPAELSERLRRMEFVSQKG